MHHAQLLAVVVVVVLLLPVDALGRQGQIQGQRLVLQSSGATELDANIVRKLMERTKHRYAGCQEAYRLPMSSQRTRQRARMLSARQ